MRLSTTSIAAASRVSTDLGAARDNPLQARAATIDTPIGPFTVIVTDAASPETANPDAASPAIPDGAARPTVLASGWTATVDDLLPLIAADLRPNSLKMVDDIDGVTDRAIAYHAGDLHAIDDVPVWQRSGPFLNHAWTVLRAVPAGRPVTYTEFADRAGRPTAVRAAGSACARNAAALFVPCHRVVPAGGGVGSFRWGPPAKRWLLGHEAAA